jgi:hypothetical protein
LRVRRRDAPAVPAQPSFANSPPVPRSAPADGSRFQVTIKHEQERSAFYVTLSLRFSQDTINLIKARRLEDHIVISGNTKPPVTKVGAFAFDGILRIVAYLSPIALLLCIPVGIFNGGLGGLLLIGGIVGILWCLVGSKKVVDTYDEQFIRIKYFFRNSTIRLYASSAIGAKVLDSEIRESLKTLRFVLDESVSLPDAETFDV